VFSEEANARGALAAEADEKKGSLAEPSKVENKGTSTDFDESKGNKETPSSERMGSIQEEFDWMRNIEVWSTNSELQLLWRLIELLAWVIGVIRAVDGVLGVVEPSEEVPHCMFGVSTCSCCCGWRGKDEGIDSMQLLT
jgi:hypothetical protein